MTIELLSKPACVQCNATVRALDKKGVEYTKTDMSQEVEALDLARSLGHQQAPVILIKDEDGTIVRHWSGFDPENIEKYV